MPDGERVGGEVGSTVTITVQAKDRSCPVCCDHLLAPWQSVSGEAACDQPLEASKIMEPSPRPSIVPQPCPEDQDPTLAIRLPCQVFFNELVLVI